MPFRRIGLSSAVTAAAIALTAQAASTQEVTLPQIVVTAPSPIQQRAPRRAANAEDNAGEHAQPAPAESNPWLPSFVADTFNSMVVMKQNEIERTAGGTLGAILFDEPPGDPRPRQLPRPHPGERHRHA